MGVAEDVEKGKGYCVGNMSRKGQKVTLSLGLGHSAVEKLPI